MIKNTVLLSLYSLLWSFPIPIILSLCINQLRFAKFKRVEPMQTLSPMVTWSAMPTCPARKQLCPTFEVPAMPVWAEETVFSPICTLWPIWIRLSSFTPRRMTVESVLARSMQVLAPISTSSSMMTGSAPTGSSTPPSCDAAERCTLFPTCAHEPTSA